MKSRREFIQLAAITATLVGARSFSSIAAKQSLTQDELLGFDSKGCLLYTSDAADEL